MVDTQDIASSRDIEANGEEDAQRLSDSEIQVGEGEAEPCNGQIQQGHTAMVERG